MSRSIRRICLLLWLVGWGFCPTATAQPNLVDWEKDRLEISLAAGESMTVYVRFTPRAAYDAVTALVDDPPGQARGSRLRSGEPVLGDIAPGRPRLVSIIVTTFETDSGTFNGTLTLRSGNTVVGQLPIVLTVAAQPQRNPCIEQGNGAPVRVMLGTGKERSERELYVPTGGCRVALKTDVEGALPARTASFAWVAHAINRGSRALLRIELRARGRSDVNDLSPGEFVSSSDVARSDQQLLVRGGFDGWLELTRLDALDTTTRVDVILDPEPLRHSLDDNEEALAFIASSAEAGHSFRTKLDSETHSTLVVLSAAYRSRGSAAQFKKADAYRRISDLIGRRVRQGTLAHQSKSEPMVVFLGLSGLNRLILIDCLSRPMPVESDLRPDVDCPRLAEPWQTTLERADHFWAVYIENEESVFDTSVDVAFPDKSDALDYDDFDALNTIVGSGGVTSTNPNVRIGYRRFAIPSRQDLVRVTFTRQGAAYGLKSWSREFERYGISPVQFAGGIAAPGWFLTRTRLALADVYGNDPFSPAALELVEERTTQPILAMGFVRFPKLRAAAQQATGIARYFIPDLAYGIALPWIEQESFSGQSLIVGGSWQVGLGDSTHFLAAFMRRTETDSHLPLGQRVPVGTSLDSVRSVSTRWRPVIGLSFDVARTP